MTDHDPAAAENAALRARISALSAASLRISASLDLETVLNEVVESARALTSARYGGITTIDEAGGERRRSGLSLSRGRAARVVPCRAGAARVLSRRPAAMPAQVPAPRSASPSPPSPAGGPRCPCRPPHPVSRWATPTGAARTARASSPLRPPDPAPGAVARAAGGPAPAQARVQARVQALQLGRNQTDRPSRHPHG